MDPSKKNTFMRSQSEFLQVVLPKFFLNFISETSFKCKIPNYYLYQFDTKKEMEQYEFSYSEKQDFFSLKKKTNGKSELLQSTFHFLVPENKLSRCIRIQRGQLKDQIIEDLQESIIEYKFYGSLYLSGNNRPLIIHQIKDVRFSRLKFLSIGNNMVQSIQSLCRVRFDALEGFGFEKNQICQLKSIRKCYWPNFKGIGFRGNQVSQTHWLCEIYAPDFYYLFLQEQNDEFAQESDLRWLMKNQSNKIKRMCMQKGNKRNISKFFDQFNRKYQQNRFSLNGQ